jgi:hypothetical protein
VRETGDDASIVLLDAAGKIVGVPDVERPIDTFENVNREHFRVSWRLGPRAN